MRISEFESIQLNKEMEKKTEESILDRLNSIKFNSVAHARKMMGELNSIISSRNEKIDRLEAEIKQEKML